MKTQSKKNNNKAGMAILGYHGSSIVIQSANLGDLKELLSYLHESLYDSISACNKLDCPALASEFQYIQNHLECSFNHIIEL